VEGARRALLVATREYQDVSLRRLRAPARDAEEFARVLQDPNIGGFDVVTAINEPSYQVRRQIQEFLAEAHIDDTLLLYFSCHGVKDDGGRLFLATTDTEIQYCDSTSVESNLVSDQVRRSRARRIVVVLDCCYSGAFAAGGQAKAGDHVGVEDHLELGRGRLWLTSSNAMEYSFEGSELERGERSGLVDRSLFTEAMVRGLKTGDADLDGDGRVSVDELYEYVFDEVQRVTPNQHPRRGGEVEGRLYIARNLKPPKPAVLPPDIQACLASPSAGARLGVVTNELKTLLEGSNRPLALAAEGALQRLSNEDDSFSVRKAAAGVLEGTEAAAPEHGPVAATVPEQEMVPEQETAAEEPRPTEPARLPPGQPLARPGPADLRKRVVAKLIDISILSTAMLVVLQLMGASGGLGHDIYLSHVDRNIGHAILVGLGIVYLVLSHGRPAGQTLGEVAVNVRMADALSGRRIGYGIAIARSLPAALWLWALVGIAFNWHAVSSAWLLLPALVNAFWPLWDAEHRTVLDKLLRTNLVAS
jgi:uncharacterized RDD family membrane protein YckC